MNTTTILTITLLRERTDWREWIKTLGDIVRLDDTVIEVIYQGKRYIINRSESGTRQKFTVDIKENTKDDKAKGQDRYLIFFKGQDADAMTAAFKEYTEQIVNRKSSPSVLAKLEQFKALIQSAVVDRTKKKELER